MAERITVVCDVCGKPSVQTVAITANDRSYRKDLCAEHLAELLRGTSAPRRGRPRKPGTKVTVAMPTAAPTQEAPKRRGRPPRLQAAAPTAATASSPARPRRKITDPAILAKRRAALVKARQARANKRAAARTAG
jgi:hypothetical protein